ncbi:uroporphyrinogen-III synthase [Tropicimonas sediminicola]|uniref:Uroporphyrinogen-III synthase n=1 Tax=Tropicimonas sediminicola TaxID=1031541 RepID=A0A239KYJ6_9RHOB|nr:uroporphyrinogen-III synthase [Tropicimonas sediminicola]SNT22569.1 uroporphyrinogen-III synthase [Tropicimonas sediminicola]
MNISRTTLLLTRPETASLRFRDEAEARLGAFGAVVVSPLMEIVPVAFDLPEPLPANWVFTSAHAIPEIAARIDVRGRKAWCVGVRTAQTADSAGFEICSVEPDVTSLCARIRAARPAGLILHAAGHHRRGDLAGDLNAAGLQAQTVTVYDQQARALSQAARDCLMTPGDVLAPLFSPRSARLLGNSASGRVARLHAVAISQAAAEEWEAMPGERLATARTPDADAMLKAMVSLFDADRSA